MTYSMKHAAKAAGEFVQHALKDGDRCSVTAVQDVPRRKQPLTADRAEIAAALAGITPTGRTALYDAVASAIRELREEKNRRAIVVLTDGSDTASNWSFDEIDKTGARGRPSRSTSSPTREAAKTTPPAISNACATSPAQTGGFVATATAAEPDGEVQRDREGPPRAVRDHVPGLRLRQVERMPPRAGGGELAEADGAGRSRGTSRRSTEQRESAHSRHRHRGCVSTRCAPQRYRSARYGPPRSPHLSNFARASRRLLSSDNSSIRTAASTSPARRSRRARC